MMDCSTVEERLNMALGGTPLDAEAEKHLSACAACRALRDDLAAQDRELQSAFAPLRHHASAAADAAIAAIRREPLPQVRTLRFFPFVMAAAAGFLLAVIAFRPWRGPVVIEKPVVVEKIVEKPVPMNAGQTPEPVKRPMAKLEVATGAVQASRDGTTWSDVAVGSGCEMDTWVRCSPEAKAEFVLSDASVVRLDSGTLCFFGKFRKFRLDNGRLFARVAPGLVDFNVTTENGVCSVRGAEDRKVPPAVMDVTRVIEEGKKVVETATEVLVLEGTVTVRAGQKESALEGPRCTFVVGDEIRKPQPLAEGILATRWVHDLLARRGESAELSARVRGLLANVARSEAELRKMGDACAKPIVSWACASDSKMTDEQNRRQAVQIAADLATTGTIPELISLLEDDDAGIRSSCARALERLTGLSQGCGPSDWANPDLSRVGLEKWKVWQKEGAREKAAK